MDVAPLLVGLMLAALTWSLTTETVSSSSSGKSDRGLGYHYPTAEESHNYYAYQQYEPSHYYPVPCEPSADGLSGLHKLLPLGSGLVGSVAKALATGLSAKLPLLLFKILLKAGLLYFALPYVASVVSANPITVTGNFTTGGRRSAEEGGVHATCVKRLACQMGVHSAATLDVARFMKSVMESAGPEARRSLESCREAYSKGQHDKTCRHHYPCEYLDDFIQMLS